MIRVFSKLDNETEMETTCKFILGKTTETLYLFDDLNRFIKGIPLKDIYKVEAQGHDMLVSELVNLNMEMKIVPNGLMTDYKIVSRRTFEMYNLWDYIDITSLIKEQGKWVD